MRRLDRTLAAVAVAASLAAVGAGCGHDTSSSTPTAAATGTPATGGRNAVKFAECVRRHGVADFPDPDAKGDFDYGVSVTPTVWRKAVGACAALKPPGALSAKRTPKEQAASLTFAQCVRANGVKDFPDPVEGEPIINTYKIPSSNRPGGMRALNAATSKCHESLTKALEGK